MDIKKKQEEVLNYALNEIIKGNAKFERKDEANFLYFNVQDVTFCISEFTGTLYGCGSSIKMTDEQRLNSKDLIAKVEAEIKANKIKELNEQINELNK